MRVSKWRKTFAFATAFAILGALFHSFGHGTASIPGLLLILFVSAVLAIPAARLTVSRRSLPVVFGALFGGQLLLHVIMAGVGHGDSGASVAGNSVIPGLHMTTMHAGAAVISAGIIYFADSIAVAWSRFLASVIGVRVPVSAPVATRVVTEFAEPQRRLFDYVNGNVFSRGPPLASVIH